MLQDLGLLLLGWLLGTLSPGIVDAIATRKRIKEFKKALAVELHELRFDAALSLGQHRGSLGLFDAEDMKLVKPVLTGYSGGLHADSMKKLQEVLKNGDEAYILIQNRKKPGVTKYPVNYELPFLTAHMKDLMQLSPAVHRAALQILREVRIHNEKVRYVQQCHERTFDTSLGEDNAVTNLENLHSGIRELGLRVRFLIKAINEIVDMQGSFRDGTVSS